MFPEMGDLVVKAAMDAFARPVTFLPAALGAVPQPMRGIFDAAHEVVELDAQGVPVSSRQPVLSVRVSEFQGAGPRADDRFLVGAKTYQVFDQEPDGQGALKLILKEV